MAKPIRSSGLHLRRSYRRELRKTLRIIQFSKKPKEKKQVSAAVRQIKSLHEPGVFCISKGKKHKNDFRLARNYL